MFGISWQQLLILALIVALVFGTKRLRNAGSDLGAALRGFKKGLSDEEPEPKLEADPPEVEAEPAQASQKQAKQADRTGDA